MRRRSTRASTAGDSGANAKGSRGRGGRAAPKVSDHKAFPPLHPLESAAKGAAASNSGCDDVSVVPSNGSLALSAPPTTKKKGCSSTLASIVAAAGATSVRNGGVKAKSGAAKSTQPAPTKGDLDSGSEYDKATLKLKGEKRAKSDAKEPETGDGEPPKSKRAKMAGEIAREQKKAREDKEKEEAEYLDRCIAENKLHEDERLLALRGGGDSSNSDDDSSDTSMGEVAPEVTLVQLTHQAGIYSAKAKNSAKELNAVLKSVGEFGDGESLPEEMLARLKDCYTRAVSDMTVLLTICCKMQQDESISATKRVQLEKEIARLKGHERKLREHCAGLVHVAGPADFSVDAFTDRLDRAHQSFVKLNGMLSKRVAADAAAGAGKSEEGGGDDESGGEDDGEGDGDGKGHGEGWNETLKSLLAVCDESVSDLLLICASEEGNILEHLVDAILMKREALNSALHDLGIADLYEEVGYSLAEIQELYENLPPTNKGPIVLRELMDAGFLPMLKWNDAGDEVIVPGDPDRMAMIEVMISVGISGVNTGVRGGQLKDWLLQCGFELILNRGITVGAKHPFFLRDKPTLCSRMRGELGPRYQGGSDNKRCTVDGCERQPALRRKGKSQTHEFYGCCSPHINRCPTFQAELITNEQMEIEKARMEKKVADGQEVHERIEREMAPNNQHKSVAKMFGDKNFTNMFDEVWDAPWQGEGYAGEKTKQYRNGLPVKSFLAAEMQRKHRTMLRKLIIHNGVQCGDCGYPFPGWKTVMQQQSDGTKEPVIVPDTSFVDTDRFYGTHLHHLEAPEKYIQPANLDYCELDEAKAQYLILDPVCNGCHNQKELLTRYAIDMEYVTTLWQEPVDEPPNTIMAIVKGEKMEAFNEAVKKHNLDYGGRVPYVPMEELKYLVSSTLGYPLEDLADWGGNRMAWEKRRDRNNAKCMLNQLRINFIKKEYKVCVGNKSHSVVCKRDIQNVIPRRMALFHFDHGSTSKLKGGTRGKTANISRLASSYTWKQVVKELKKIKGGIKCGYCHASK